MFLVNGLRATLRKFNRNDNNDVYNDENYIDIPIKVCPYNINQGIKFGIQTVPNAKGYYQVNGNVDVKQGDQIIFVGRDFDTNVTYKNQRHTVLDVQDMYLYNRVENKVIAVK